MLRTADKITFPIIAKLGGETAVLDIIEANSRTGRKNPRRTEYAVRFWKTKRQIPALNAAILQQECERLGIEWSWDDFVAQVPSKPGAAASREIAQ